MVPDEELLLLEELDEDELEELLLEDDELELELLLEELLELEFWRTQRMRPLSAFTPVV